MVKKMIVFSGAMLALMFVFWSIFITNGKTLYFTLGIIALTISFHFTIRLVVAGIVDFNLKNHVDYTKRWFRSRGFERGLYKTLRVKKWKKYMPTARADDFSLKKHTFEEILMAGCQAEIAHEFCAISGFLSMFFAIPFGFWWVFLLTSFLGALYDCTFVMIQRFNRPRLMKIVKRKRRKLENQHKLTRIKEN